MIADSGRTWLAAAITEAPALLVGAQRQIDEKVSTLDDDDAALNCSDGSDSGSSNGQCC